MIMKIDEQLRPLREQIDDIDSQILALLNARARLVVEIGHLKKHTNAPVFRAEREAQILRHLTQYNDGPLPEESIRSIFLDIISACRALERPIRVAYLGPVGTFTEQAVWKQFGHAVNLLPAISIDEVFRTTEAKTADFGMVPIENSSEGAVNRTLDLLLHTSLFIHAEVSLPVAHSLMTLSGEWVGIHKICAHSQTFAQCQTWLNQHYPGVERVAVSSNGEAARLASLDPTIAAIAGVFAQTAYQLQVVHANIQDDPHNRTRFVVMGHGRCTPSGQDKTSLILATPNHSGALYHLLAPLAQFNVSMTHFESRPARTGSWEYYFYLDIEGHEQDEPVQLVLAELKKNAAFFKLLGSYPRDI